MAEAKRTAAQIVADNILDAIKGPDGLPKWRKPWIPPPGLRTATNASTDKEYRGINAFVLGFNKYAGLPAAWGTFKQWQALGEKEGLDLVVKKGEKASPILVPIVVKDQDAIEEGRPDATKLIGTKLAFGFHFSQVQHGEAFFDLKYGGVPAPTWELDTIAPALKTRIAEMGFTLKETASNKARYSPSDQCILMPKAGQFADPAEYYATLLHEWTHATERDDLPFQEALKKLSDNKNSVSGEATAFAELRAELGALLLAQKLGLPLAFGNSASYIESWALQGFADKHPDYILSAAKFAQNAVDAVCTQEFMIALQERRNATIQKPLLLAEWEKTLHVASQPVFAGSPGARGDLSISPADLQTGKRYSATADPGHGWLVVPVEDLIKLGIEKDITPYSYLSPRGGKAYLEEDCDASRFLLAYQSYYGLTEDIPWHHFAVETTLNHDASCRNYAVYDPDKIAPHPQNPEIAAPRACP